MSACITNQCVAVLQVFQTIRLQSGVWILSLQRVELQVDIFLFLIHSLYKPYFCPSFSLCPDWSAASFPAKSCCLSLSSLPSWYIYISLSMSLFLIYFSHTHLYYREHFHCAVPLCKGKDFAKKEEMIRHSKWHQKEPYSI